MGNIKRVVAGAFAVGVVSAALAIAGGATASAATAIEYGAAGTNPTGIEYGVGTDATAIEYGLLAAGGDATPDIVAGAYKKCC